MESIKELTASQAVAYNIFATEFNAYYQLYKGSMRYGQAFYNFAFKKDIYDDVYPELFYAKDPEEVKDMIEDDIMKYIRGLVQ